MIQICTLPDGQLHKLGSGAHGTVFKAVLDDIHTVAVKQLSSIGGSSSMASMAPRQLAKFEEEIQLMAACRHSNCVQFFGACLELVSRAAIARGDCHWSCRGYLRGW